MRQDEEWAKEILFRYEDRNFSFADAVSFVVMERLGIQYAFTFDHHFVQDGPQGSNTDDGAVRPPTRAVL